MSMSDIQISPQKATRRAISSVPPAAGPLAKREARLAWGLLMPTLVSVALVIILPLLAIFWISAKPISLADLRPTAPIANERMKTKPAAVGDEVVIEYRLRNSSREQPIGSVTLVDDWPAGLEPTDLGEACSVSGSTLTCNLGDWEPGHRDRLQLTATAGEAYFDSPVEVRDSEPVMGGDAKSELFSLNFTLENFQAVFDSAEFLEVLWVTTFYTVVGTIGALVVGMMAALILNKSFTGQGILRGLFLFPYVAPVIAVAFTWVTLLDPYSGSFNALLVQMG